ncbi:hypothetical protein ZWY2020_055480 [Hordeum vulgare]|nr:hypothetical protein ZWY2020_055480 [Hordeum vulgare]
MMAPPRSSPFLPPPVDAAPINIVPLSAVSPRAKPAWICAHFDLPLDLTITFIDEKAVTSSNLDTQQNRFRLPTARVLRSLRPILSPNDPDAATIPCEGANEAPRPPRLSWTEEEV